MKIVDFEGRNAVFTKDNCQDLPAYQGTTDDGIPFIISCWAFDKIEFLNMILFRRIWFNVWSHQQPPVLISATSPFNNPNIRIDESDAKEKAERFKHRLINSFLSERNICPLDSSNNNTAKLLSDFIDYICERGE